MTIEDQKPSLEQQILNHRLVRQTEGRINFLSAIFYICVGIVVQIFITEVVSYLDDRMSANCEASEDSNIPCRALKEAKGKKVFVRSTN
jgi:hypothetical protein